VKTPNCEIIRREVSIFRGGAGGMFFDVSSGSFRGSLRVGASDCPKAVESHTSVSKEMTGASGVENLMSVVSLKR
jgi:hypothetical protein